MTYIVENLRLKELTAVVKANKPYFDEFIAVLGTLGYTSLHAFIMQDDDNRAQEELRRLLSRESNAPLFDGVLRPYAAPTANWYFLAWMLRDAPAQRLGPLVAEQPGSSVIARRAYLLNRLRRYVQPLLPTPENWTWTAISEVLLARLEGSRRALRGTLFEALVRRVLTDLIATNGLPLTVSDGEVRLHDETYDVEVQGPKGRLLLPVKTRETMGGGHALLFTRDIHKSISVAIENGFQCIPIVIAESWGGDLSALASAVHIYVQANPNQIETLETELRQRVQEALPALRSLF